MKFKTIALPSWNLPLRPVRVHDGKQFALALLVKTYGHSADVIVSRLHRRVRVETVRKNDIDPAEFPASDRLLAHILGNAERYGATAVASDLLTSTTNQQENRT